MQIKYNPMTTETGYNQAGVHVFMKKRRSNVGYATSSTVPKVNEFLFRIILSVTFFVWERI